MPQVKSHLQLSREPFENNRRKIDRNPPRSKRGDLRAHGKSLGEQLSKALDLSKQQVISNPGTYVLKIQYSGAFNLSVLNRHGIEFISQEDKEICIVFANEVGLTKFADHLNRLGLANEDITYKDILVAIEGIDNWSPEERSSWALKQFGYPDAPKFLVDIELWPIHTIAHPDRKKILDNFEAWLTENSIKRIDQINLDSLVIYRLEVDATKADLLLNHIDVRKVDLPPRSGITYQQLNVDIEDIPQNIKPPSAEAARVCILDSGINTNHPLLAPAIGESASFIPDEDEFDEDGHGTAVAGIALYGDLEACKAGNFWNPEVILFNGKILNKHCEFDLNTIEKTLIDSVTYFKNEHKCKIFNLSIGNLNAPYEQRHMGNIAYVIDKLARELDVLFIVSAGNFTGSTDPDIPRLSWRDEYPDYLLAPESILIDPAPALNVLTIGSVAKHNATFNAQRYPEINDLSPASENQPSPFTRHGPSIKGAIKPDLIATGGNLASPVRNNESPIYSERGLGVLTCNHKFTGNTLLKELSGTSFAAPYVTHLAGRLFNFYPKASANLLRALLLNHANMPAEVTSTFSEEVRQSYKKSTSRKIECDVGGYGLIDEESLYSSSENVVVMMVEDKIKNDEHHFYDLPFPEEFLRTKKATRQIRVTLAYSPAVRTTRLDYVATKVNFRLVKGRSLDEVQRSFNQKHKATTETRNDACADKRTVGTDRRDRGTLQSCTWTLKQLKPTEKWFIVVTRQDRDWASPLAEDLEKYALVITVTDRENENATLYTDIAQIINLRAQTRARVTV